MVKTIKSTPRKDGFRMPGEFETHQGTWMLWPTRTDTWRAGAKPAQQAYAAVANAIAEFEPVTMGVSSDQFEHARVLLNDNVRVVEISSDDAWMRDIGPTFVKNDHGEVRGIDWGFNAWGGLSEGLYFPWDQDLLVKRKVLEIEQIDRYDATDFVIEGGAFHTDGEGTLLTTEQCLLNPNRNPHLSKEEIENKLKDYLNIEKVIWLKEGLNDDETDGHVDIVAFYVRPGEVAIGWTDDQDNPQYEVLQNIYEQLRKETDAQGRKLKIYKVPMPEEISLTESESREIDVTDYSYDRSSEVKFSPSYINCYLCNGAVILPIYGDPQDEKAIEVFKEMYPERQIVTVNTKEVSFGGGNIHCITQQQPMP